MKHDHLETNFYTHTHTHEHACTHTNKVLQSSEVWGRKENRAANKETQHRHIK